MPDLTAHVNTLADPIREISQTRERTIVAIAGAPGSGKSTLASELGRRLNQQNCQTMVLPMDGFHLDNAVLEERGDRSRKGAPHTFDARGFVVAVERLRARDEVAMPIFDRQRDIAIAGALIVPPECPVLIVEGNYLLFDQGPWATLAQYWDLSAWLDVPMPEIRARLIQRWLNHGLSRAAATRRAETNDIPNAQKVIGHTIGADIVLDGGRQS